MDERDDEVQGQASGAALPGAIAAAGAALAGAAFLPLKSGSWTWFDLARWLHGHYGALGLALALAIGAPFVFGVVVAVAGLGCGPAVAAALRGLVALLQAELVYVGLLALGQGDVVAPVALAGFAAVTGGALVVQTAAIRAAGDGEGPGPLWQVRWGALLIAGGALWLRAQALAGAPIGAAIDVALAASAVMLVAGRRG